MLKLAVVVLAAATLSACASFAPHQSTVAGETHASFDAAPVESFVPIADGATMLSRRLFSPPSRRQPDLRAILVTPTDRRRAQLAPARLLSP